MHMEMVQTHGLCKKTCVVVAQLDDLPTMQIIWGARQSDYREERAARMKLPQDQARGRLAEYCLLAALDRCDISYTLPLSIQTGAYGKPCFANLPVMFSLSHAGQYAVAAISLSAVGVDIERIRPVAPALALHILCEAEQEALWLPDPTDACFCRLFSAKESVLKRSGRGFSQPMREVNLCTCADVQQQMLGEYVLSVCSEWPMEVVLWNA